MRLIAIILTLNEAQHLERCVSSVREFVDEIIVVDSFSTDATVDIAKEAGARVLQRHWTTHADQFNWALSQLNADSTWIFRIDADEYVTPELASEIKKRLQHIDRSIDGVLVNRRIIFQGKPIRFGGIGALPILRIFRSGRGRCEARWMDEHIDVPGKVVRFNGLLIDASLKSLSWWIEKHNDYASREVIDLLNLEYGFMPRTSVASLRKDSSAKKRWIKENVYSRLPLGSRAVMYFLYRYLLRFGFLDGGSGFVFHFLQGMWYRLLVDVKLTEVRRHMKSTGADPVSAINQVLGIRLTK